MGNHVVKKTLYLICADYVDVNIPLFFLDLTCINGNILKNFRRDLLGKTYLFFHGPEVSAVWSSHQGRFCDKYRPWKIR